MEGRASTRVEEQGLAGSEEELAPQQSPGRVFWLEGIASAKAPRQDLLNDTALLWLG